MEHFENIVGKGENAGFQYFFLYQQYFLPIERLSLPFEACFICHLQMIISQQNKCCPGYTVINLSVGPSICVSVHVSACVQNTSFRQSTGGRIKSHLVTALVSLECESKILRFCKELVQIEGICSQQNECDSKIKIWLGKFRKHCGKKEKILVTSISSFSQNVFYPSQNKF